MSPYKCFSVINKNISILFCAVVTLVLSWIARVAMPQLMNSMKKIGGHQGKCCFAEIGRFQTSFEKFKKRCQPSHSRHSQHSPRPKTSFELHMKTNSQNDDALWYGLDMGHPIQMVWHTFLEVRPGDEVENLLSDQRYKRAPTIPALSQSAAQHRRVNCK